MLIYDFFHIPLFFFSSKPVEVIWPQNVDSTIKRNSFAFASCGSWGQDKAPCFTELLQQ